MDPCPGSSQPSAREVAAAAEAAAVAEAAAAAAVAAISEQPPDFTAAVAAAAAAAGNGGAGGAGSPSSNGRRSLPARNHSSPSSNATAQHTAHSTQHRHQTAANQQGASQPSDTPTTPQCHLGDTGDATQASHSAPAAAAAAAAGGGGGGEEDAGGVEGLEGAGSPQGVGAAAADSSRAQNLGKRKKGSRHHHHQQQHQTTTPLLSFAEDLMEVEQQPVNPFNHLVDQHNHHHHHHQDELVGDAEGALPLRSPRTITSSSPRSALQAAAAAAASGGAAQPPVAGGGGVGRPQGLAAATLARFKIEGAGMRGMQAAAAGGGDGAGGVLMRVYGSAVGGGGSSSSSSRLHTFNPASARLGLVVVDDDDRGGGGGAAAGAGGGGAVGEVPGGHELAQIFYGAATARGGRPYMEDRHVILAALPTIPHTTTTLAAAAAALNGSSRAHTAPQDVPPAAPAGGGGVAASGGPAPRSYLAIFDGHNGAGVAEVAAAQLHLHLLKHPALGRHTGEPVPLSVAQCEEPEVGDALRAAFAAVDDVALKTARRMGTRDGATALVLLRLGAVLYSAHAGDSRAVLCRDGAPFRLTEDHKPHLARERARIEGAGGRVDFQRCWRVVVEPRDGRPGSGLAVSRSLGDLDFKEPGRYVESEPDVTRLLLRPGDSFLVAGSDGLWDVMSDGDVTAWVSRLMEAAGVPVPGAPLAAHPPAAAGGVLALHPPGPGGPSLRGEALARAAAESLLEEALRRGSMDNVTVIVALLQWA